MSDKISTSNAPKPVGLYPHARKVGNLLFLSGVGPRTAGTNANDSAVPGLELDHNGNFKSFDFEAQCRSVFDNVKAVLEASGSSWDKLVDVTVSFMVITSVFFGSTRNVTAMPMGPTDETKVPHYFGPWPNWANSPFTLPNATVEIVGDGTGATAVAKVDPVTQGITSIDVTSPGTGYTTANVIINGGDGTATETATVNTTGVVTSVNVDVAGGGYTSPQVSFSGGGGAGTVVTIGNPLIARANATDYATAPGTLAPVFVIIPGTMPSNGVVQEIQYFNQATAGSSPNPSAGNLFHAYILHPTGNANLTAQLLRR